jgi:enoyl-CoA hydratase/carnithine racemase
MNGVAPVVDKKITIERRDRIVLIGINRPDIYNRIDPEAYHALAKAHYNYDQDQSLRAAVLFGHGEHFSRGIDVDAFAEVAKAGNPLGGADEARRLGVVQKIAPDRARALELAIAIAERVARCAPLGIQTTLASAHLAVDRSEEIAFLKLSAQFGALFRTQDYLEGRKAEAKGRLPAYVGK